MIHGGGGPVGGLDIRFDDTQVTPDHFQGGMTQNMLKGKYIPPVSEVLDGKRVPETVGM